MNDVPWGWSPRATPLTPVAVFAAGAPSRSLARSASRLVAAGRALRAAAGSDHLLVLAQPDDLPWADGATYLGRDGPILLPTTQQCSVHLDLLAQALRQRYGTGQFLVVPGRVVAFAPSLDVADPDWLARYGADGAA
jgi:MoxR-vWA-beta-propeller ternary system protein